MRNLEIREVNECEADNRNQQNSAEFIDAV